ncbi:MAG: ATP-grasp domain-containing protein [Prolixibacteraceae bacterium]
MIIAELPYVSALLRETIIKNNFEVVRTENSNLIFNGKRPNFVDDEEAVELFRKNKNLKLFTNSENSISWMIRHLGFTDLPRQIELFKNKVKFREFMQAWHPNYFFQEIKFEELKEIDISNFPKAFVIKPAIGFFSLGVHVVNSHAGWPQIVDAIYAELEEVKTLYPIEVFDTATFIAEEIILGDEFAFDAYYTASGEPVILNIYQHPFASGNDVSDRVYLSSEKIVRENLDVFTNWLKEIGQKARIHNFPLHVEVRVNDKGEIQPIEVNPLRFGGFCTTADCTWFSYGLNSYEYFFNEQKPDWDSIFKSRKGKLYSLLVLNNSTGVQGNKIKSFNFEKIAARLEKPLEIRPIDFKLFPLFGFIFTETRADNYAELQHLLNSDLKEFIEIETE